MKLILPLQHVSEIVERHKKIPFKCLCEVKSVWVDAAESRLSLLVQWCRPVNTYLQRCGEKSAQGNDKVTPQYFHSKPSTKIFLFWLIRPLLGMTLGGAVLGICLGHKSQCRWKIHKFVKHQAPIGATEERDVNRAWSERT